MCTNRKLAAFFLVCVLAIVSAAGLVVFSHVTRAARRAEMRATDRPESAWMNLTDEQRDAIKRWQETGR